jgi:hypothetical protein
MGFAVICVIHSAHAALATEERYWDYSGNSHATVQAECFPVSTCIIGPCTGAECWAIVGATNVLPAHFPQCPSFHAFHLFYVERGSCLSTYQAPEACILEALLRFDTMHPISDNIEVHLILEKSTTTGQSHRRAPNRRPTCCWHLHDIDRMSSVVGPFVILDHETWLGCVRATTSSTDEADRELTTNIRIVRIKAKTCSSRPAALCISHIWTANQPIHHI